MKAVRVRLGTLALGVLAFGSMACAATPIPHPIEPPRLPDPRPPITRSEPSVTQAGQRLTIQAAEHRPSAVVAYFPGDRPLHLGETNAAGQLETDLDAVTPADWTFAKDAEVTIEAQERSIGRVALRPLFERRDAAAWQTVENSSACAASLAPNACRDEEIYLAHYPGGDHAQEARVRVDAAATRRQRAQDAEAFARVDLAACRKLALPTAAAFESTCAPLQKYVSEFPNGEHAEATREALRPALAFREKQEAAEAKLVAAHETQVAPAGGGFIPYHGNGGGPTQCADGSLSHSSGRGTCSHHGGVAGGSHRSGGSHTSGHSAGSHSSGHGASGGHRSGGHSSGGRSGGRRK